MLEEAQPEDLGILTVESFAYSLTQIIVQCELQVNLVEFVLLWLLLKGLNRTWFQYLLAKFLQVRFNKFERGLKGVH